MQITGTVNFKPITDELRKLSGPEGDKIKAQVMQDVGAGIITNIRRSAPKDTGKYSRTWRMIRHSHKQVILRTTEPKLYKMLEITGSQPHIIRPRNAKYLHWCTPDGREFFRLEVKHPGFQPIPHVRPTLKHVLPQAPYLFYKHLVTKFRLMNSDAMRYRTYIVSVRKTVDKKRQGYKCSQSGPRPDET